MKGLLGVVPPRPWPFVSKISQHWSFAATSEMAHPVGCVVRNLRTGHFLVDVPTLKLLFEFIRNHRDPNDLIEDLCLIEIGKGDSIG